MDKNQNNEVALYGGLGNQLFQFAAGLYASDLKILELDCTWGKPRLSKSGQADIFDFKMPPFVKSNENFNYSKIRSFMGLKLLVIASKKFSGPANVLFLLFKTVLSRVLIPFSSKRFFLSDGIGYDPRLRNDLKSARLVGNFHTFRWANEPRILNLLKNLQLKETPAWLSRLELDSLASPIVVHIRRGDYVGIKELGFLSERYYKESISYLANQLPSSPIWIFSDDFQGIAEYIPIEVFKRCKTINFEPENSAANLMAMRLGFAYVISNSTYSWWGAFLSETKNPTVICPKNWFATKPNALDLIPPGWIEWENR